MLSTFVCWAVIPLAALYSARIILALLFLRSYPRHFLNGALVHLAAQRNGLLQHFELAHDPDQPHSRLGAAGIGILQVPLPDSRIRRRARLRRRLRPPKVVVAMLGQSRRAGKVGDPQLADED